MKECVDDGRLCNCCAILALNSLRSCYSQKGLLKEAIETLEECLAAQPSFLPPVHPDIATSYFFVITILDFHVMTSCLSVILSTVESRPSILEGK